MAHLRLKETQWSVNALEEGGVTDADGTVRVPLLDRPLLLGRGAHCDLVANSGRVAREDTWFEPTPEGWVARNLGHNQGMIVNGERVVRAVLRPGDEVFLYGVVFVFEDDAGA